jgi:hypothetical protein
MRRSWERSAVRRVERWVSAGEWLCERQAGVEIIEPGVSHRDVLLLQI